MVSYAMCACMPREYRWGKVGSFLGSARKSKESILGIEAEYPIVKIISPLTTALRAGADVRAKVEAIVETVASTQRDSVIVVIKTSSCRIITEIIIIFIGEGREMRPPVRLAIGGTERCTGGGVGGVCDIIGRLEAAPKRATQTYFRAELVADSHSIGVGIFTLARCA